MPHQSNVYFSSADADFADRYEAAARWAELRAVRESFGDLVFDAVLPHSLGGLVGETRLLGRLVQLIYTVRHGTSAPREVRLNGELFRGERESNPYRTGGLPVSAAQIAPSAECVRQPARNRTVMPR
jgi:1,2-beta-oligoglucan phosphorylase